jgi:aminoglycoside phosphotransferase (APT) family kinase protein
LRANDPTPAGGFLPYGDVLERYAKRTGRDLSDIGYYVAFSCWRLAVISEGVYARYVHGAMGDDNGVDVASFKNNAETLAERAMHAFEVAP